MIKHLFKRSSIYFSGLVISKVMSTLTFIVLARELLPEGFGIFVLFLTIIQVITFIGDFGLVQWYQKHAEQQDKKVLLHNIIGVRFYTLIISLIGSVLLLSLFKPFDYTITILLLLSLVPEAFLSVLDGYYLEQGKSFALAQKTMRKTAILLVGYAFTQNSFNVTTAAAVSLVGSLFTAFWYTPWKELTHFVLLPYQKAIHILKHSSSYAALIFTSLAYSRGDALIIGSLAGTTALGYYNAAYRYLETISLLPTALAHNLFPISAKKEGISLAQLKQITLLMTSFGLVFATILFFTANFLTTVMLGPRYLIAQPIVQIFAFAVVLFFANASLSTVVQSSEHLKKFLPFGIANTILNLALNIVLVPFYGINAAAWIMVATELTGLLINVYFVKKIYD